MGWKDKVDRAFTRRPVIEDLWVPVRAGGTIRKYRRRREGYAKAARDAGLVYSEAASIKDARKRLRDRGYTSKMKPVGNVHTFAFIPRVGWHDDLYRELSHLGPVTEFDYASLGFSPGELRARTDFSDRSRKELSEGVIKVLRDVHEREPVDWVFIYASGSEITPGTVTRIQGEFGIPVVGMCLDDKQSWEGPRLEGYRGLQIDIAPALDIAWTSSRVACEWYLAAGGRPLYLPEGFALPSSGQPLNGYGEGLPVSFVGARYGFRAGVIRFLERNGVTVSTFGEGWESGRVSASGAATVYARSRINLGMGGIGYCEDLTNIKGRDFEVPAAGGGVYLTSFNPDLALHFDIGREILCYRSRDEMLELIRYYLAHPGEAREIAAAGYRRCLSEHRWLHRFVKVCEVLAIIGEGGGDGEAYEVQVLPTVG